MQPWTVLESRYLIERRWLKLRQDRVRLPSGAELDEYHVLEYPDWACVVCLTDEDRLVMVEQYRHAIARVGLELPAGALDPDEDPLVGAQRELLEETGYASDDWTLLGHCTPEPGRHTNRAYIYAVRGAQRVQAPDLDAAEDLRTRLVDPVEALRLADASQIDHGIHIAALFWAARRGFL